MSTLQKTNLAPGTKRFPIFTLFTRYSEHNGPFFSLSARPRRPQTVCAIEEALTSYSMSDAFGAAGNHELDQRKAQILTFAFEHKAKEAK